MKWLTEEEEEEANIQGKDLELREYVPFALQLFPQWDWSEVLGTVRFLGLGNSYKRTLQGERCGGQSKITLWRHQESDYANVYISYKTEIHPLANYGVSRKENEDGSPGEILRKYKESLVKKKLKFMEEGLEDTQKIFDLIKSLEGPES